MQNRPSKLLLTLFLVCITINTAQGQTRRRPAPPAPSANTPVQPPTTAKKRPATINIKNGETVNGNFIQASGNSLRIEVEGTPRNINLDDVVSITFRDEASAEGGTTTQRPVRLSPQAKAAARDALKALRKMAGATEIGINFQEYGSRVIDAKADVEEGLRQLPDGELKTEISLAMEAYADAGMAWNGMIRYDFMLLNFEPGATLQKKYSIPVDRSLGDPVMTRNAVLSTIWQAARAHLDKADALLGQ